MHQQLALDLCPTSCCVITLALVCLFSAAMRRTTNQHLGFSGIFYLLSIFQICCWLLLVPSCPSLRPGLDTSHFNLHHKGIWEGQQTVSTLSFDFPIANQRSDCEALSSRYVFEPAWTKVKIFNRKCGYNGLYVCSPTCDRSKPTSKSMTPNNSIMLTLCIILSNDVQMNPGPLCVP